MTFILLSLTHLSRSNLILRDDDARPTGMVPTETHKILKNESNKISKKMTKCTFKTR